MNCRYVASDQPRVLKGRHDDECPELAWHAPLAWIDCWGCEECTRNHCAVQWHGDRGDCQTHAESVCPACLGKVREHLGEVVRLSGLPLLEQILSTGDVDSEAADLLGPAANPHQWRQRGDYGHLYDPETRLGGLHPLWVLGKYDMLVTEHLGHTRRTGRITVVRAAGYLGRNLTWLAADAEFDFVDMANDLRECRTMLERVVHDGEQVETGAPCMTCRVPLRLIRDAVDHWQCPRCKETSTEEQYRFAVKHLHREEADWLTDREMELRTGVKAGTVRKWAERGAIRKRQDSGRRVFAVAEVEAEARRTGLLEPPA